MLDERTVQVKADYVKTILHTWATVAHSAYFISVTKNVSLKMLYFIQYSLGDQGTARF